MSLGGEHFRDPPPNRHPPQGRRPAVADGRCWGWQGKVRLPCAHQLPSGQQEEPAETLRPALGWGSRLPGPVASLGAGGLGRQSCP